MTNVSVDFESFTGAGFAPVPTAGQLDSDLWRVTGLSDGATSFGGTFDSGDYARGTDADGGVSSGGVYAFQVSGNTFLGFQPTGSDVTPGTITLRITNDTGSTITSLDVSYDIMVNNDQPRANTMNFAWSLDDATYTAVAALDYTSPEVADALGFQTVARSATLTGFSLAAGETMYIQWQTDDATGGGSRDELGLDNISVTVPAPAGPSELFFSEYVEGSSNNKALEIYNGTGAPIDLAAAGYTVEFYFNGGTSPGTTISLTGTVAAGDVFVLADDDATAAILAEADQTSNASFFNGDDAIVLKKNGVIIDVIGQIGTDPGSEWSGGGIGTQNETLRRDGSVLSGDADGSDAFDPSAEWTGFAQDSFDGLGSHGTPTPPAGTVLAIAATDAMKAEGDSGTVDFTFTVTRSGDTSGATDVDYAVSGTDVDAADFGGALPSGTVSFAAGETSKLITVQVSGDTDIEFDEAFTVTLSNATGGATIATAAADGTIQTDDVGITAIHDIQGATDTSPLVGQTVTVEAVVVGDFQDGDADTARNMRGFYLQEEDADVDGNLLTSEGIFVFDGSAPGIDVNVGDIVQVTGTVQERFGETQISNVTSVTVVGSAGTLPTASVISLPSASVTTNQDGDYQPDLEAYEGMRVTFSDELTISEMFQLDRFNEIKLIQGGREQQYTQTNTPDAAGYDAFLQNVGSRTITYDDGLQQQNALIGNLDGFGPVFSTASDIRMGDTITDLSGVLTYQWAGNSASGATWRVISTFDGENSFTKESVRPTTPTDVGGTLKVTSLNVLNFFSTIDETGVTTANGFDPRGADSIDEYNRQLEKLATAIIEMDADILGLVELENDFLAGADGNAIEHLVEYLNAELGAGTYAWVDPGTRFVGSDAIAVGVIYKPAVVQIAPGTTVEVLTDGDLTALGLDSLGPVFDGAGTNRSPIAVTFEQLSNGAKVNVVVTHMKSKGSEAPGAGNADLNDGVGTSNQMRLNGVTALNAWLDTDPTGSGDDDVLLLGDFNAYSMEDPITYLEGVGFTDLVEKFVGPDAYSFVFDGLTGTLDYAFANEPLTAQITGTSEWAINADEPDAIDYNLDFGKDGSIFDGSEPFRASDHDPVIVGLALDYEGAIVVDNGNATPWTSYFDTFSGSDGSRIAREFTYDDGRVVETTYESGVRSTVTGRDLGDTQHWDSFLRTYDSAGELQSNVVVYDDGRTSTITYSGGARVSRVMEDTADSFVWAQQQNDYDAASGDLVSRVVTYDDGRISTSSFADGVIASRTIQDAGDIHDWHRIDITYDAAGNEIDRSFVYDSDVPLV
ncbi:ExeM/NucH family extracellular endonuclease [Mameliella alba]|nr:ExeM/NucH family extracellular endonuclease [Mameliella alba]MBY6168221.1 ExeM/NucH family extracellular endonuclease [Mameliella alba]MBY6173242.1 ExeM/NucH family extracellular endonuclease [Mameliella alba]